MKKFLVLIILALTLFATNVNAYCVANVIQPNPFTRYVYIDVNCDYYIDYVEIWKLDRSGRWVKVAVRKY